MRMTVLGDKKVEIISPKNMEKRFGSITAYVWKNGILYITREALESEKKEFGKHFSTEEVLEDIYINARDISRRKIKKGNPTVWEELLNRHIDPKYRREPFNV